MEDFKRRSTASFGGLDLYSRSGLLGDRKQGSNEENPLTAEPHLWLPSLNPVYRQGDNMEGSTSDDEMAERRRRAVPVVGSQEGEQADFLHDDEFEYDEIIGSRPSMQFCSQLDKEDESDMIDMYSLQFDDTSGVSQVTSVARAGEKKPLPPALKKANSDGEIRLLKRHKRVSFTGIPEPPKPYVPPHKRATTKEPNKSVPDFVKNPQAYTHYEFDEPVVVGGGIAEVEHRTQ